MKIEYKSGKLRKQLEDASEIKKAFGSNAKRVSARMDDIRAAPNLAVLIQVRSANCHPLSGDKKGEWAVDISGNYRIIFEIDQDPVPIKKDGGVNCILVTDIRILSTIDYH